MTAHALDVESCKALLRTRSAGHLGLSKGALPVVIPVAYTLDADHLWIFAGAGVEARSPAQRDVVALHAGASVAGDEWLWSVLVQGRAEQVAPGFSPAPAPALRCLRLSMDVVTGWQFGEFDARSYLTSVS